MTTVLLLSKLFLISDDIRRLWKGFLRIGNHYLPSCPNQGVNTNFQQQMSFFISQTERTHVAPCRESILIKHLLLKDNSILILLICIYCVCVCVHVCVIKFIQSEEDNLWELVLIAMWVLLVKLGWQVLSHTIGP